MSDELKGLYKFGGVAFIVSALLFLSRALFELMAGPPPSSGVEILAWVESGKLALSFVSELLFFAAMALVPAVIALYHSLASARRRGKCRCGVLRRYARSRSYAGNRHDRTECGDDAWSLREAYCLSRHRFRRVRYRWRISLCNRAHSDSRVSSVLCSVVRSGRLETLRHGLAHRVPVLSRRTSSASCKRERDGHHED